MLFALKSEEIFVIDGINLPNVTDTITVQGQFKYEDSNVKNKNSILEVFNGVKIAILAKSYRSTANITNFAKEIPEQPTAVPVFFIQL